MSDPTSFPSVPKVELEAVADPSSEHGGFLTLRRYELVIVDGGARSSAFRYDLVDRAALDAAVIAAHFVDAAGEVRVYLRTALRPPLALRAGGLAEARRNAVLWELPAGLIEPGESPNEGAARELEEELGFTIAAGALAPLGPMGLPSPSFVAEAQFFFHVRVDPSVRKEPRGDGSAIEASARIEAVPLEAALLACRRGELPDTKTELALRRLAEILSDEKA